MPEPLTNLLERRQNALRLLEAEAIHIFRETAACFDRPVLLYSIGKDSATLVHLAKKAFAPAPIPFPLLHVDTTFKFREMLAFRDAFCAAERLPLIVHQNPQAVAARVNPFDHGSQEHTRIWKTEGLLQALKFHRFDAAIGGARREEERSRAKERIFSLRSADHGWDPRQQRPELWQRYNPKLAPGESMRVFPLSNWTELDIWLYIHLEQIPVVPLYFSSKRPVVRRNGSLIMVDDNRLPLERGEQPELLPVRFRTLGCYPLTGAVLSDAKTTTEIVLELLDTPSSERQNRLIDHDSKGSMEQKKREGYF